jgi:hypothetical protein
LLGSGRAALRQGRRVHDMLRNPGCHELCSRLLLDIIVPLLLAGGRVRVVAHDGAQLFGVPGWLTHGLCEPGGAAAWLRHPFSEDDQILT